MNKTTTWIILIAGNSTRYWKDRNKNFELLSNKPIIQYSIEIFNDNSNINEIVIAIRNEDKNFVVWILDKLILKKTVKFVIWWSTRQESVYNALQEATSDIVIIHDGARPLLKHSYINNLLLQMDHYIWATIWVKSKDTIKISNVNWEVILTTDRPNTWIVQTPQCFNKKILLEAHKKEKNNLSITDDCMLIELAWEKIKMIEWDYTNIKITTFWDINILEEFLKLNDNK